MLCLYQRQGQIITYDLNNKNSGVLLYIASLFRVRSRSIAMFNRRRYNVANYHKSQSLFFKTIFHQLYNYELNVELKPRVAACKLRYFVLSLFLISRRILFSPHVYKVFIFKIFVSWFVFGRLEVV